MGPSVLADAIAVSCFEYRIETIYVDFDELTAMASKQFSSGLEPQLLTLGTISSGHVPNPASPTPVASPIRAVVAPEPVISTVLLFLSLRGVPIPEPNSKESSSRDVISTNVKLDKLGGVLKNKARSLAWGYHQEEGIDFEESFASVA
ncbi:hypothetical protein Tco_0801376 [Tanacetum coccineum]|uniref:Uncharacterized protein n=1 Tax=Tanacetum coccineum TaxID=301880 RepID=A0ABQ4ZVW3_9ASTR